MNSQTCDVVQDLLPLYLDDCCTPGSRALVDGHLQACADCRKLREQLQAVPLPIAGTADADSPQFQSWLANLRLRLLLLMTAGALAGFVMLNLSTRSAGLTLLLMPALGALALLYGGKRWHWLVAGVAVLGFCWHVVFSAYGFGPFTIPERTALMTKVLFALAAGAGYAALSLLGAGLAALLRYALRAKTAGRWRRALAGGVCALTAAALAAGVCAYTGDPITRHMAEEAARAYASENWPQYTMYLDYEATTVERLFEYQMTVYAYGSEDVRFTVACRAGQVLWDTYETQVLDLDTARRRIWWRMTEDTDLALAPLKEELNAQGVWLRSSPLLPETEGLRVDIPYTEALLAGNTHLSIAAYLQDGCTPDTVPGDILARCKAALEQAGLPIKMYDYLIQWDPGDGEEAQVREWRDIPAEKIQ